MKVKDLILCNDWHCVFCISDGESLEFFDTHYEDIDSFLLKDIAEKKVKRYEVVCKNGIMVYL